MSAFEMRHVVGFEETNLVGNVYFVHHLRWQGRCRELFLRAHVPELIGELARGLCLVTTHASCEYLDELDAFDEVLIRMRLGALSRSRVTMTFEYWRVVAGREQLVARGEQGVACMRREAGRLLPSPFPAALERAFRSYSEPEAPGAGPGN